MHVKSSGSVKIFSLDRDEVLNALAERSRKLLSERDEVLRIVLFGSFARGDYAPGSDADIAIIVNRRLCNTPDRTAPYQPYFTGLTVPVDILAFSNDEWSDRLSAGNHFIRRIDREGMVLAILKCA